MRKPGRNPASRGCPAPCASHDPDLVDAEPSWANLSWANLFALQCAWKTISLVKDCLPDAHGGYSERGMRIDPKARVRGYPTMLIRQTLRRLRGDCEWGVETLENAAKLPRGAGRAFAKALQAEGLIEVSRQGGWTVTQAGDTERNGVWSYDLWRPWRMRPTSRRPQAAHSPKLCKLKD